MSARTLRLSLRALHLFAALGIFGYVYGTATQQMAQFLFVPMLTLSGLIMGSGTHSVLRPYYQTSYYLPPFLSAHE